MADKANGIIDEGLLQPEDRAAASACAVSIDWALYGSYLEESNLSDDQKREFIETLWSIVLSFVDLGFSLDPNQGGCEQKSNSALNFPAGLLSSEENIPKTFLNRHADETPSQSAEREES